MDNEKRLLELMEGTDFRFGDKPELPDQLMELAEYNYAQYRKIEAMPEERQLRIINLISAIFADFVHPKAIEQFGHTDNSAIIIVLWDNFFPKHKGKESERLLNQWRKEALEIGVLSEDQVDIWCQWCLSYFPFWFVAFLANLLKRWKLLPRSGAQNIATALADIIKEAVDADIKRHN